MGYWQDQLDAVYGTPMAVDATLEGASGPIRVMDKTAGYELPAQSGAVNPTISPAATVRVSELAARGVDPKTLTARKLTMNGTIWEISTTKPKPSPEGEASGEIVLILKKGR